MIQKNYHFEFYESDEAFTFKMELINNGCNRIILTKTLDRENDRLRFRVHVPKEYDTILKKMGYLE